MSAAATIALAALFAAGAGVGLYARFAPRTPEETPPPLPPLEPWSPDSGWTAQAGEEFAGLSEAARCDLLFAVADLHDERSHQLLLHALNDPSETVAIAAAHALARRGEGKSVEDYANRFPGDRARRIAETLALLG